MVSNISSSPTPSFPSLQTRFETKYHFIDQVSATAAKLGFKLWINEVRGLKNPRGTPGGRLELSCYKSRAKDAAGKKTRVGGCKFFVKAIQVFIDGEEAGWRYVGGIKEHNHELGPPLKLPKPSGPRPPRTPGPPKAKKIKLDHLDTSFTTTTPPEESLELSASPVPSTSSRLSTPLSNLTEFGDLLTGRADAESQVKLNEDGNISIFGEEGSKDEAFDLNFDLLLGNSSLPTGFMPSLTEDELKNIRNELALEEEGIEDFLKREEKDLEQYTPGFVLAGYDTTTALIRASPEVLKGFLETVLPSICTALYTNPYQLRLITKLVQDLRDLHPETNTLSTSDLATLFPVDSSLFRMLDDTNPLELGIGPDFCFDTFIGKGLEENTEELEKGVESIVADWDIGIYDQVDTSATAEGGEEVKGVALF